MEAKTSSITTVSRKYNIPRSTLRDWITNDMRPTAQYQRLQRRGRQAKMTKKDLDLLGIWIDEMNDQGVLVDSIAIEQKVKSITGWKPSQSWVSRSLHKLGFSSQRALSKIQCQLSKEKRKEVKAFREELVGLVKQQIIINQNLKLWAMDEKGIWDYSPALRTYTRRSIPKPYVRGLYGNNGRDTIVGCVNNCGERMPISGIESRNRKTRKGKDSNGSVITIIVQERCRGMNNNLIKIWFKEFVKFAKRGDILIMDNLQSHKIPEVYHILEEHGIEWIHTPAYLASEVSPLDNSLFSVLGRRLRKLGIRFNSYNEKMETTNRLWKDIPSDTIINYFRHCKIPFYDKETGKMILPIPVKKEHKRRRRNRKKKFKRRYKYVTRKRRKK